VAASDTPANRFGSTLITLARAIERLYEILQHPAVRTAYGAAPDQADASAPAASAPAGEDTAVPTAGPAGTVAPAAVRESAAAREPAAAEGPAGPDAAPAGIDAPGPPSVPLRGREPEQVIAPPAPPPVGVRARRSIPQDVKISVSARDGGRCRQCGSTAQLHFDHVIPISRGGANTVANIQLLCGACNRAKGAKMKLAASRGRCPRLLRRPGLAPERARIPAGPMNMAHVARLPLRGTAGRHHPEVQAC
jgi:hypothetical protein